MATSHFPSQMGVDYYFLQQSKLKKTITKKRFTNGGASRNDERRSQPQFRKRI